MNILKISIRLFAVIAIACCMAACANTGTSVSNILLREAGWKGESPYIYWSVLDAIDQSLSLQVNQEDLHTHQIRLRMQLKQSFTEQANLVSMQSYTLCNNSQDASDWANIKCNAYTRQLSNDEFDEQCKGNRCIKIRFASFVIHDEKLLNAVRLAMTNPCTVIPDFQKIQARHRGPWPRGAATMHGADTSYFWLFCGTKSPIKGNMVTAEKPDIFIVRWER